jgi:hypothetical protein
VGGNPSVSHFEQGRDVVVGALVLVAVCGGRGRVVWWSWRVVVVVVVVVAW